MRKLLLSLALIAGWFGAAAAQTYSVPLLTNASTSGTVTGAPAGDYRVWASGTFSGASVAITATVNGQASTLATITSATGGGATHVCVGAGELVQAVVTGGAPSGLYVTLAGDGPCPGTGGGGGAISAAAGSYSAGALVDDASINLGSLADTAYTGSGGASITSLLKGIYNITPTRSWTLSSGTDSVNIGNFPSTQAVTGTFWQATQPVSALSLPLPPGAATAANQTNGSQLTGVLGANGTGFATLTNPFPMEIADNGTLTTANATAGGVMTGYPLAANGAQSISIVETSSGTASTVGLFESNDDTNFYQVGPYWTAQGIYSYPLNAQYYEIKVVTFVSGTVSVTTQPRYAQPGIESTTLYQGGSVLSAGNPIFDSITAIAAGSNIIGKVDILGNAGATLDAAPGSTGPTDYLAPGCIYTTSPTEQSSTHLVVDQCDQYGASFVDAENPNPSDSSYVSFVPSTGIVWSMCGSSSKTVKVRQILITGTATTAGSYNFSLLKTSTAPTGGTATALTFVAHSTVNATSNTASGNAYTAAPTGGTSLGAIDGGLVGFPVVASNVPFPLVGQGSPIGTQAITLSGTSQCLEISTSTSALTGPVMTVTESHTEE